MRKFCINVWYKFFRWLKLWNVTWQRLSIHFLNLVECMLECLYMYAFLIQWPSIKIISIRALDGDKRILSKWKLLWNKSVQAQKYSCTKCISESLLLPLISTNKNCKATFFFYNTHSCCINVTYIFRYHKNTSWLSRWQKRKSSSHHVPAIKFVV